MQLNFNVHIRKLKYQLMQLFASWDNLRKNTLSCKVVFKLYDANKKSKLFHSFHKTVKYQISLKPFHAFSSWSGRTVNDDHALRHSRCAVTHVTFPPRHCVRTRFWSWLSWVHNTEMPNCYICVSRAVGTEIRGNRNNAHASLLSAGGGNSTTVTPH
jgi:hypothetical protein